MAYRTVALSLAASPLAGLALVLAAGLDRHFPLTELVAYTPYAAVASVLLAGAALGLRRWAAATVALAVAVVFAVHLVPRMLPDDPGATAGPRLRVLTANLHLGEGDAATVVDLVRRHRVDLLAVQEFTVEARAALAAAGLDALLPNTAGYPFEGANGSAMYSRFPLWDEGVRSFTSRFRQAQAELSVPGAVPLAVESVHPCSPGSGPYADACWARELGAEPRPGDGRTHLLLGDFNATLDHSPLRALLGAGYRDAADVRGAGLVPTWPFDGRPLPPITIDHVLAQRGIGVTAYAVYPVPRSDHRAVFAELVLPPG